MLAYMLTTLIMPVAIFNKLLFVLLMIWTIGILMRPSGPKLVLPAFVVLAIFLYGYLLSILFYSNSDVYNDHSLALQFLMAGCIPLLIHFVEFYSIDMDYLVELCGKMMVSFTAIYWFLCLNQDVPYSAEFVTWFNDVSNSRGALPRDYLGESMVQTLALSTVAFLYVPWCMVCKRLIKCPKTSDFIWVALLGLTMVVSGRRGTILVALVFLLSLALVLGGFFLRLFITLVILLTFLIFIPWVSDNTLIFSSSDVSNSVKVGHLISFINQIDPTNIVFGKGLGSIYYSLGVGERLPHTELTPIDYVRYIGLPLTVFLYLILLFPKLYRQPFSCERKYLFMSFFLYLILSMSNPTLVNSYGMLVVLWYWVKYREPLKRTSLQLSMV